MFPNKIEAQKLVSISKTNLVTPYFQKCHKSDIWHFSECIWHYTAWLFCRLFCMTVKNCEPNNKWIGTEQRRESTRAYSNGKGEGAYDETDAVLVGRVDREVGHLVRTSCTSSPSTARCTARSRAHEVDVERRAQRGVDDRDDLRRRVRPVDVDRRRLCRCIQHVHYGCIWQLSGWEWWSSEKRSSMIASINEIASVRNLSKCRLFTDFQISKL